MSNISNKKPKVKVIQCPIRKKPILVMDYWTYQAFLRKYMLEGSYGTVSKAIH